MRSFMIITLLAAGAHFATIQAEDVDELRKKLRGDPGPPEQAQQPAAERAPGTEQTQREGGDVESAGELEAERAAEEDIQRDAGAPIIAIEIDESGKYVIPTEPSADDFNVIELAQYSKATHLDAAGVQRSAAGRPIDAQPGSLDAALTGMQHDIGSGTVRNTVSPEPTPSPILAEIDAKDPDIEKQPTPKAAQGLVR